MDLPHARTHKYLCYWWRLLWLAKLGRLVVNSEPMLDTSGKWDSHMLRSSLSNKDTKEPKHGYLNAFVIEVRQDRYLQLTCTLVQMWYPRAVDSEKRRFVWCGRFQSTEWFDYTMVVHTRDCWSLFWRFSIDRRWVLAMYTRNCWFASFDLSGYHIYERLW